MLSIHRFGMSSFLIRILKGFILSLTSLTTYGKKCDIPIQIQIQIQMG